MAQYGFKTTADDITSDFAADIQDKIILTTGVSPNGLGAAFVEAIAKGGPKLLILAGRDPSKVEETAAKIKETSSNVATKVLTLDLGSLAEVKKAAAEVIAWSDVPVIDVLVNNAGIMAAPYGPSPDGFDNQFATNHLGHFLFTNLIIPKLLASGAPRIVQVSSDGARLSPIRFQDYSFDVGRLPSASCGSVVGELKLNEDTQDGKTFDTWLAYGQSKTANILFARSLAKKLGGQNLIALSVHPGVIATSLMRYMDGDVFNALLKIDRDQGHTDYWHGFEHLQKSPVQGAATHARAAFDKSLDKHNGAYLADCQLVANEKIWPWARDDIGAEMLWQLSEKLVGQKFEY